MIGSRLFSLSAPAEGRGLFGRLMRFVFGSKLVWYFTIPSALLLLVIGAVAVFAITRYMSSTIEAAALEEAQRDVAWDAHAITTHLPPGLFAVPASGPEYSDIDQKVRALVGHPGVVRIKIWSPDGQIVYSDEPSLVGQTFPIRDGLARALGGDSAAETSDLDAEENQFERDHGRLLEIYAPIRLKGTPEVAGVLEVYEDYGRIAAHTDETRRTIFVAVVAGVVTIYAVLFVVHRWGASIMGQQRDELLRQNAELEGKTGDLERSYYETLAALARALDQRDHATENHGRRVSELAIAVAREMGLGDAEVDDIGQAAIVHDIGKMTLPDAILSKPGPLTGDEWQHMRRHPEQGYEMLKDIPVLMKAAEIVYAHHERYDGKGYPRGLISDKIPIGSRIFAVVDTYDAITSDRPYREAASHQEAMQEILRCTGTQFDPQVVRAFRQVERMGLVTARARPGPPKSEVAQRT